MGNSEVVPFTHTHTYVHTNIKTYIYALENNLGIPGSLIFTPAFSQKEKLFTFKSTLQICLQIENMVGICSWKLALPLWGCFLGQEILSWDFHLQKEKQGKVTEKSK